MHVALLSETVILSAKSTPGCSMKGASEGLEMLLLSTPSETRSLTSVLLAENACEENPVLASVVVFSALRSSTFMRVLELALPFAWMPARAVANRRDCLLTETGRVEVKGAPPGPQTLAPPHKLSPGCIFSSEAKARIFFPASMTSMSRERRTLTGWSLMVAWEPRMPGSCCPDNHAMGPLGRSAPTPGRRRLPLSGPRSRRTGVQRGTTSRDRGGQSRLLANAPFVAWLVAERREDRGRTCYRRLRAIGPGGGLWRVWWCSSRRAGASFATGTVFCELWVQFWVGIARHRRRESALDLPSRIAILFAADPARAGKSSTAPHA